MRDSVSVRIVVAAMAAVVFASFAAGCWAISLKEEIDLGRKLDDEILKQTPLIADKKALAEIDEYGQKLVANVTRPEIKYHFRIIDDDDFNAFATPGGYVYFTERLWNVLRKDERIGVLGHEIVHSDQRHALDAISKQRTRQIWLAVILAAAKANRTITDIVDIAHGVYSLKYSRAAEKEADTLGLQLVHKAGYNPVGLLLAMRKISRFQSEQGGSPPKIFSSHPPTTERLNYIESMLKEMGLDIPPDNPPFEPNAYKIGEVTAVRSGEVRLTASKPLQVGQVVWAMNEGWDFHYEKRTPAPAARLVITSAGADGYSASVQVLPRAGQSAIVKGIGVYDPPTPKPEESAARIEFPSKDGPAKITAIKAPKPLQRYLARQVVWNKDYTKLVYSNIGYLTLIDPSSPAKYVYLPNPAYRYVSLNDGANLVPLDDDASARWLGPIVSIGRRGGTIEIATNRNIDQLAALIGTEKRFDVVSPAWDPKTSYEMRIAAKAAMKSVDGKIVLQILSYSPGWSIERIANGLDVYEALPEKKDADK